jgi:hypothetical protein
VLLAVPLGVLAGAAATFFSAVTHGGLDRLTRLPPESY